MEKQKAIFKLKIKNLWGVSAIASRQVNILVVEYISLKLLRMQLSRVCPYEGDLQDDITTIELSGCINIKMICLLVWQAKLHKDTSLAKFAGASLVLQKMRQKDYIVQLDIVDGYYFGQKSLCGAT